MTSVPSKDSSEVNWKSEWMISLPGAFFFLFACLSSAAYPQSLSASDQVPLAGSRVFGAKGCSNCHAVNGVGGKIGPDLGRIQHHRSFSDVAAAMWNHLPKMVAAAKKRSLAFPYLTSREVGDLIAFLFTVNYFEAGGNVDSGKKLFALKGCIRCHQIAGVGGVIGPSLDSVGQARSPFGIAAAMWNHGAAMAETMRAYGVRRPSLSASELRDLTAYLRAAASERSTAPVAILPGNVNDGRRLFAQKLCIRCHNLQGRGGKVGPDLGKRGLFGDVVEFAAALWNKAPAMLQEMKIRKIAAPALTPDEMADIVSYLRAFQYFGEAGSPVRGQKLLAEKRCVTCHSGSGEGSKGALDLARVEDLGSPASVIAALWNHGDVMMRGLAAARFNWPPLTAEEVTDLMAFFRRPTGSRR